MNKYDDIINIGHYEPKRHKRMSMDQRAAQFAPFAALVGYDSEINESNRLTDEKKVINEDMLEILNEKLNFLNNHLSDKYEVVITYFVKDSKKDGGKYVNKTGVLKRVDQVENSIIFNDNMVILIDDIIDISGDIFNNMY